MKKLFVAFLVVGLLAVFILSAQAQSEPPVGQDPNICDVSFNVDVLKLKGILITKVVTKNFEYNLNVETSQAFAPLQLAEVEAFKCDLNEANEVAVEELGGSNNIFNSFSGFVGIVQLNMASGLLNNQGNILAAGFTDLPPGETRFGVSMVEVAVEKTNVGNELNVSEMFNSDNISSSFNIFTGLAQLNMASGLLNNQNNVVVIGTNLNTLGIMAENDTFLSMQNVRNEVNVAELRSTANISDSFQNGTGAVQLNLGPGAVNDQTNIISVAFTGRNIPQ
jgi:hypothetical protein